MNKKPIIKYGKPFNFKPDNQIIMLFKNAVGYSFGLGSNDIKHIFVNEKTKTVYVRFQDGSLQVSKCHPDEEFDLEIGVALAYARHAFGSKNKFKKMIEENTSFTGDDK